MAGRNQTLEVDERALVKSASDGLVRSLLPEPWQVTVDADELPPCPQVKPVRFHDWLIGIAVRLYAAFSTALSHEAGRGIFFLLVPVLAGCGAIIYFVLPFEPAWASLLSILAGLLGRACWRAAIICRRRY